jgi:hypothetical protein
MKTQCKTWIVVPYSRECSESILGFLKALGEELEGLIKTFKNEHRRGDNWDFSFRLIIYGEVPQKFYQQLWKQPNYKKFSDLINQYVKLLSESPVDVPVTVDQVFKDMTSIGGGNRYDVHPERRLNYEQDKNARSQKMLLYMLPERLGNIDSAYENLEKVQSHGLGTYMIAPEGQEECYRLCEIEGLEYTEIVSEMSPQDIVDQTCQNLQNDFPYRDHDLCMEEVDTGIERPQVIHCNSVREYMEHFEKNRFAPRKWLYRGHSDVSWRLESTLSRFFNQHRGKPLPISSWDARERRSLQKFKSYYRGMATGLIPEENDTLGWLAIMQHYGAPTRLLDFSLSPLVALYFALEDAMPFGGESGKDVFQGNGIYDPEVHCNRPFCVHAIEYSSVCRQNGSIFKEMKALLENREEEPEAGFIPGHIQEKSHSLFENLEDQRLKEHDFVWLFDGSSLNDRQRAQDGVFAVPSNLGFSLEDWLARMPQGSWIQFVFPNDTRQFYQECRNYLKQAGLSGDKLFPGLDGVCRNIKESLLDVAVGYTETPSVDESSTDVGIEEQPVAVPVTPDTSVPPLRKTKGIVDIVFLIDITGAMQPCIDALADNINNIVSYWTGGPDVNTPAMISDLRIKVCGYRDYESDGDLWWVEHPFVANDVEAVKANLQSLEAKGGGDEPECLLDGLWKVANMGSTEKGAVADPEKWRHRHEAARVVIVITDTTYKPACLIPEASGATLDDVANRIVDEKLKLLLYVPEGLECYYELSTINHCEVEEIPGLLGEPGYSQRFIDCMGDFTGLANTVAYQCRPLLTGGIARSEEL